ncbi:MAG: hypothetical protein RSH52_15495, partial [Janthinobacterium sp.]
MSDLFALAMPWWEFILRAVIVYVVVLVMVRVAGKRTLGQFTPFDMLLLVLLGNAVQNALLGQDTSLGGGLLLALTLITLNYLVGWITTRSPAVERVIEGEPVVLARHGHVLQKVLQRELVSKADFAKVASAKAFAIVTPFQFGMPTFDVVAIVTMSLVMIVVMIESLGM